MENVTGTAEILWRGKYLIAAGLVLGVIAATAATALQPRVYQASGLIQVASSPTTIGADVLGLQQASQNLASTYSTLITSRSFLARIRPRIEGGRLSVGDLASNVGAKAVTQNTQNTNLIEISAQGASPDAARSLAQQVANAFVRTVSDDDTAQARAQQAQLQAQIKQQTAQINKLNPQRSSPAVAETITSLRATRAALTQQLAGLMANAVNRDGSVSIVAPPTAEAAPIKPRKRLNLVIGALLGLLVGIGAAWLRSAIDRQLHSSDEIEPLAKIPVLASIPLRRNVTADDPVTREAYDVLRTNLTFLSLDAPVSVLTVTSSESGEGKTATAEGLARAIARRDLKVLLVDGDLRTGKLSAALGASGRPGLVNAIATGAAPLSLLVNVAPGLALLPAGPTPPNPPSILASPKMADLLRGLRGRFDLIVIDSPPVGHLADAALLAALSDTSIIVARAGMTERSSLVAAVSALARTHTPVAGAVVYERRALDPVYYPAGGTARAQREPEPTVLPTQPRVRRSSQQRT